MWADLLWVYLGGGNKRVRCGVSVVPGSEVSVVGGDDGVLLSLFHIAPETNKKIAVFQVKAPQSNSHSKTKAHRTGRQNVFS